jgi:PhnB protein
MIRKNTRSKAQAKKAAVQQKKVQPVPAGYHSVTPYLSIRGAAQAIEFYKKALGAKEVMRMPGPDGKVGHAELQIGDSRVMLADEYEAIGFLSPQARGGTTVTLHVYVKDADAMVARASAAGAKITRPVEDQFYGDRTGSIEDPFGHVWHFATRKEALSMAELKKRAAKAAHERGSPSA